MLKAHHEAKIGVFVVRADRRDLDRRLLMNFTMMDDNFLQMDVPNKEGHAVEYLYSENRVDVERALNAFAQLKSKATKYTGSDSLSQLFGGPGGPGHPAGPGAISSNTAGHSGNSSGHPAID
jgi:hypothetical protein